VVTWRIRSWLFVGLLQLTGEEMKYDPFKKQRSRFEGLQLPSSRHQQLAHLHACKLLDPTDTKAGDVGKTGCGRLRAFQARNRARYKAVRSYIDVFSCTGGSTGWSSLKDVARDVLSSGLKGKNKPPVDPWTLRREPKQAPKPRAPCAPSLDAVFDGLQYILLPR
jgi:hypothetical protein